MSTLVTRGLGKSQRLVTAGLGNGGVQLLVCTIVRTLELASGLTKAVGLTTTSTKITDLATNLQKSSSVSVGTSSTINISTSTSKDLSCR